MRIVSEADSRAWLFGRWREPFTWPAAQRLYGCSVTYLLPADTGRKTALARALSASIDRSGEGLLWITEWGVFPSSQNMALFDGYRRSLGDDRPLHVAPGHLFQERDSQEVECLLDLVLYFFWDASLFDAGTTWLRFSHDEVFSVNATDEASLRAYEDGLALYELKQVSRTTSNG